MRVGDNLVPPPGPDGARSFTDLTARLRELFAWCGRPKYVTLSKDSGLAPSAISNLIGKRPLSRPSEAATLRFVEACLTHGGVSPEAGADLIEAWRTTWQRLDSDAEVGQGRGPDVGEPGRPATSQQQTGRRRRGPVLAALAVLVIVLGAGAVVGIDMLTDDDRGAPNSSGSAEPRARCQRTDIGEAHDVRFLRTWTKAFRCPNEKGAHVLLQPETGSPVVSQLTHEASWFVCWTRGKQHQGGNSIWYYTQGDTPGANPKVHSWGYVAANELETEVDPDPQAFRECPAD